MKTEKDIQLGTSEPEDDVIGHHSREKYLLTTTLYDNLSAYKRIGLSIPSKEFIGNIEKELLLMLRENFADDPIEVVEIPFNEMCDGIIAKANRAMQIHPDAVVLTTAPLVAFEAGGECVHLNRLINFSGDIVGIGPRPGYPSILRQLHGIDNKPIIIIEDGSFTGNSLQSLLNVLPSSDNVEIIVLGLIFPKAEQLLKKTYKGELHCHLESGDSFLDWMPSHDFFPFIPNSGRVVGGVMGKKHFPYYLYNHASMAMPYILPYGKPDKWASLRGDRRTLSVFSSKCIRMARDIFSEMNRLNDKNLVVGDLIHSNPRTSIPVSCDQEDFSELTESVVDILSEDLQFLS